jgi:hypothetical protein
VPLVKVLPDASLAPEGEPHDVHVDTDLTDCRPYVLSPTVHTLDVDILVEPSSSVALRDLNVQVAAHFHGVSHSHGARYPYVNSVVENNGSPVTGVALLRNNQQGNNMQHCMYARCKLLRIPLGVSCMLLTISSEQLNAIKSMQVNILKLNRQGRTPIGHKLITREAIATILQQAKRDGGTLTLATLVMNCGWWHIYTFQSFFHHADVSEFIKLGCYPKGVRSHPPILLPCGRTSAVLSWLENSPAAYVEWSLQLAGARWKQCQRKN